MKVKDLPTNTDLKNVKVQLPDDVHKKYLAYCGGESQMWFIGDMMGAFFMTPTRPGTSGEIKLFPKPLEIELYSMLEWDVVEIIK